VNSLGIAGDRHLVVCGEAQNSLPVRLIYPKQDWVYLPLFKHLTPSI
jgi:hypothetical protein